MREEGGEGKWEIGTLNSLLLVSCIKDGKLGVDVAGEGEGKAEPVPVREEKQPAENESEAVKGYAGGGISIKIFFNFLHYQIYNYFQGELLCQKTSQPLNPFEPAPFKWHFSKKIMFLSSRLSKVHPLSKLIVVDPPS